MAIIAAPYSYKTHIAGKWIKQGYSIQYWKNKQIMYVLNKENQMIDCIKTDSKLKEYLHNCKIMYYVLNKSSLKEKQLLWDIITSKKNWCQELKKIKAPYQYSCYNCYEMTLKNKKGGEQTYKKTQ